VSIEGKEMTLNVSGLGIVFHSPQAARHIADGTDYFSLNYTTEEQVQSHIQNGSIVGFCTGSPGTYILKFHIGYPNESFLQHSEFKLRLGIECSGGLVCFRDLYELMDWRADCPLIHTLELADGFYHVTMCSDRPASGLLGDNQEIRMYFASINEFPKLAREGVPTLCM
jgi:hypothetical protein